ncbi:MAG: radical SAM/SPASM domain-containing protein [archaeon]
MIRKKIDSQPLSLTIEPNNLCNLKCVMCPYQHMKRKKESMPFDLYKKIIDQAADLGCKDVNFTQYNEPLTDRLLFERIKYAKGKGMETRFYSNGTLLLSNDNINKLLLNPPDKIRFSFDALTKEVYEKIRRGANYERVVKGIIQLYKEREKKGLKLPHIEVYFTVLKINKHEVKEFLKFWKGKCDFATIYMADSRNDDEKNKFKLYDQKKRKFYPCFNPKSPIIFSNGKIALCCVDVDGFMDLGDLKSEKLKDILNSKKFKEIYKAHMNGDPHLSVCKNCSKGYVDMAFSWWNQ